MGSGAYLIVAHAAARLLPGYRARSAPAITLDGPSLDPASPMGRATARWIGEGPRTIADAIDVGVAALKDAGVPWSVRRRARRAARGYYIDQLALRPDQALRLSARTQGAPVSRTTPIPEPMFDALSCLMRAVVGRDYAAVAAHSRGRLDAIDIQRRLEEDYQGPLALPPGDYDNEDVLLEDDDPGAAGFFLELWDGEGIADLHLVGYLEPRPDGTYEALLSDILP